MDQKSSALTIEHVKVSELKANEYNPKVFDDRAKNQIEESIKRFGFVDPLICNSAPNRKNILIGGHGRLKIAKRLKMKTVPVVYVNIPDIEREKELNVRLHKNQGEFDLELLGKFFDETTLSDVGFSAEELEDIFTELDTSKDEFDTEKELKKIRKPKSKRGDLYQLGPHRLYCGDSTDIESVKKVVGDEKIDMVYNDPIYNTKWLSYGSGVGGKKNYGGTVDDNKTDDEYADFLTKTMENALSVCNKDAHIFYYCDETYVPMVASLYQKLGIDFKRICLWLKGIANPVPQVAFSKVYEPCVYGTVGKPYLSGNHTNYDEVLNKDIGTGVEMIENFLEMVNVWAVQRLGGNAYEHPTEKPVTLHDKPIKRCTKIGGSILSLFGGSGGELIAAHQLKRRCFMVEIEPVFVDLIIRRWEALTGEKAVKISSHEV
ncbi:MAG: DNA modification methylase [Candidatus Pacebacteria bacterium]|jgi:DNA modification methylase|nr:DNA modification methylase [Candidatus Paceibacterota bacterium]